jgi:peptidoglycan/LPS O-acetylase OafA/YrhL
MNWWVVRLGTAQVIRGIGPVGPYWSLGVELQFYLALALVSIPMRRSQRPRRWLWGFGTIAWAIGALSQLLRHGSDIHREFGTDYRIAELATGMLLALALGAIHRRDQSRSPWLVALGAITGCALLAGFLWADFTPPWLLGGGFLAVAVVSAGLLHAGLLSTFWRRVLGARPLVWVGTISYSMYLVHWPVGLLLARHVSTRGAGAIALNLAATTVAAYALHRSIERPLHHWSAKPRTIVLCGLGASAAASLLAWAVLP